MQKELRATNITAQLLPTSAPTRDSDATEWYRRKTRNRERERQGWERWESGSERPRRQANIPAQRTTGRNKRADGSTEHSHLQFSKIMSVLVNIHFVNRSWFLVLSHITSVFMQDSLEIFRHIRTDGSKTEHELMPPDVALTCSLSLQLILSPQVTESDNWDSSWTPSFLHSSPFSPSHSQSMMEFCQSPPLQTPRVHLLTTSTTRALFHALELFPKYYIYVTEASLQPLWTVPILQP